MPSALACWALLPLRIEPDDDVVAAVAEVLRLGVSLAAVPHDGDGFALQGGWLCVTLVENSGHEVLLE